MKIILIKDHQKKIFSQRIPSVEKSVGLVSLEKRKDSNKFTIRVLGVHHIRYHYNPRTQKFELNFLSLRKQLKEKENGNHEKVTTGI